METVPLRSGYGSFLKQTVSMMDSDQNIIRLQVTGDAVGKIPFEENKVAAVESVLLKEYNGMRYLQLTSKSEYIEKPKKEEVDKLHESIAEPLPMNEFIKQFEKMSIKMGNEKFLDSQSTLFITFESEIIDIDTAGIYKSCPSSNCSRKVVEDTNETYICKNCGVFGTFQLNFLLKIGIKCDDDLFSLTSFGDVSEKLLKKDNLCLTYLYSFKKDEFDACIQEIIGQKVNLEIKISKNNIIENDIQYIIENAVVIENEIDNNANGDEEKKKGQNEGTGEKNGNTTANDKNGSNDKNEDSNNDKDGENSIGLKKEESKKQITKPNMKRSANAADESNNGGPPETRSTKRNRNN